MCFTPPVISCILFFAYRLEVFYCIIEGEIIFLKAEKI